jgi:hypothetical protein
VIWGKTFFDCFTQDSRWDMSLARWALSHGVVAGSRRGMEMELSAAGGDRRCVASSGWVGLPGQVCLSGLTLHKSWLGDRVGPVLGWLCCLGAGLAREEFGPREREMPSGLFMGGELG